MSNELKNLKQEVNESGFLHSTKTIHTAFRLEQRRSHQVVFPDPFRPAWKRKRKKKKEAFYEWLL